MSYDIVLKRRNATMTIFVTSLFEATAAFKLDRSATVILTVDNPLEAPTNVELLIELYGKSAVSVHRSKRSCKPTKFLPRCI